MTAPHVENNIPVSCPCFMVWPLPIWGFILYHSPPALYPLSTTEVFYSSSLFLSYKLCICFLALLNAVSQGLPCVCHLTIPSKLAFQSFFTPSTCFNCLHRTYHHLSFLEYLFIVCHLYRWIQYSAYMPGLLEKYLQMFLYMLIASCVCP